MIIYRGTVKTGAENDPAWDQTYGSGFNAAHDLIQTSDRGFALAGVTVPLGEVWQDLWLVKTDADGNH